MQPRHQGCRRLPAARQPQVVQPPQEYLVGRHRSWRAVPPVWLQVSPQAEPQAAAPAPSQNSAPTPIRETVATSSFQTPPMSGYVLSNSTQTEDRPSRGSAHGLNLSLLFSHSKAAQKRDNLRHFELHGPLPRTLDEYSIRRTGSRHIDTRVLQWLLALGLRPTASVCPRFFFAQTEDPSVGLCRAACVNAAKGPRSAAPRLRPPSAGRSGPAAALRRLVRSNIRILARLGFDEPSGGEPYCRHARSRRCLPVAVAVTALPCLSPSLAEAMELGIVTPWAGRLRQRQIPR